MKHYIVLALLWISALGALAQHTMQEANDLYIANEFAKATEVYEALAAQGTVSHELYYNLGNAYYRQAMYTKAVLNYERALLLAPNDEKTLSNLAKAQLFVGDAVQPIPEFFLTRWFRNLYQSATSDTWAVWSMLSFALFLAALASYLFGKKTSLRKLGFGVAAIALIFSLSFIFLASKHHNYLTAHNYAIIMAEKVSVVSAPNGNSELFPLHEGTKVRIISRRDNWLEIRIPDGNMGWVNETDLERI